MKRLYTIAILITNILTAYGASPSVDDLLMRLDRMIENEGVYLKAKEDKIEQIKRAGRRPMSDEERYWNNRQLYDEYFVFDADSAMRYATANLDIARRLNNKQWEYEWMINKSFIYSVTGLLNDAREQLSVISVDSLSVGNKIKYYGQQAYLYSHYGQLADHRIGGDEDYDKLSHIYEDSIQSLISREDPEYLWYYASSKVDNNIIPDNLIATIKTAVDSSAFDSRTDAMNCYILSRLYDRIGDKTNRMRYLIYSGMADVAIANRDIASINELATILFEEGDVERAYRYVNYSQNQSLRLPNRVRAAAIADTVSEVHRLHEKRLRASQRNLTIALIVLFAIMISLLALIILYRRRSRQLKKSQRKLEEANEVLTKNMAEITKSKSERDELIAGLKAANERNQEISMTLQEANYVKEECLGASFGLCSSYIDRFEKYRKEILKLVKAEKWKELKDEVMTASYTNRELKDFYRNFDTLFLNIYPDFVGDFNSLLRPEERLTVNPGELNTELRIYALVRLGISDSVKIATLLHCSTQTVYNYRLRIRNKAIIPKDRFAEAVKSLGKFYH